MPSILVIDGDGALRDTVAVLFEKEGFRVVQAATGRAGLDRTLTLRPNLVLVDLRMLAMSGTGFCRQFRATDSQTPLIVLSAAADEVDIALLLEMGADDFIVKPFGDRELVARVRAVLRRVLRDNSKTVTFGENEVDLENRVVRHRGRELRVTPVEYNLLAYFLQNLDHVISRDVILSSVWGPESHPQTRTVDAHVVKLRQKLESDPGAPRHFVTVQGVGYRFLP